MHTHTSSRSFWTASQTPVIPQLLLPFYRDHFNLASYSICELGTSNPAPRRNEDNLWGRSRWWCVVRVNLPWGQIDFSGQLSSLKSGFHFKKVWNLPRWIYVFKCPTSRTVAPSRGICRLFSWLDSCTGTSRLIRKWQTRYKSFHFGKFQIKLLWFP